MRLHRPHIVVPRLVESVAVGFFLGGAHESAEIVGVEFAFCAFFKDACFKIESAQYVNERLACVLQVEFKDLNPLVAGAFGNHILLDYCLCECGGGFSERHRIGEKRCRFSFHAREMICVAKFVGKRDYVAERTGKIGENSTFVVYCEVLVIGSAHFSGTDFRINPVFFKSVSGEVAHRL